MLGIGCSGFGGVVVEGEEGEEGEEGAGRGLIV